MHADVDVQVSTDGAVPVHGGSVGCGACASVLFPLLENEEHRIETRVVGKKISSTQCEVLFLASE